MTRKRKAQRATASRQVRNQARAADLRQVTRAAVAEQGRATTPDTAASANQPAGSQAVTARPVAVVRPEVRGVPGRQERNPNEVIASITWPPGLMPRAPPGLTFPATVPIVVVPIVVPVLVTPPTPADPEQQDTDEAGFVFISGPY